MLAIRHDLRLLSTALAVLILAAPLAAQKKDDDDPFATPSKTDPKKPSPKDKANGTWGSDGELRMPVDYKNLPTFGPAGCSVCVVGPSVIDLKTLKTVVELDGKYESRGMKALSAAGKYFAAVDKTPNITGTTVTVWATDTGKKVLEVPGQREAYVDFLELARDKYLLVGGRHNRQIDVWDIETGKITKSLTVPDRRVEPNKITFTPDGKYGSSE